MMFLLRRRLRRSLTSDSFQAAGWQTWVDGGSSADQLAASCSEPGWLMHLAYWRRVPRERFMSGATAVASALMKAARPIAEPEWQVLVGRKEGNPEDVLPVLRDLVDRCKTLPDAPGELSLALPKAAFYTAAALRKTLEPAVVHAPAEPAHLAMLYFALAVVHADPLYEVYDSMADAVAKSAALCARVLPAERMAMLEAARSALWP